MDCCKSCKEYCLKGVVAGFKRHVAGSGGDLDPSYYAHHFDVGSVDDYYHLPQGQKDGQKLILRLNNSSGGFLRVNVDHLSGNFDQVQSNLTESFAELHYYCCQWHVVDQVGVTCT